MSWVFVSKVQNLLFYSEKLDIFKVFRRVEARFENIFFSLKKTSVHPGNYVGIIVEIKLKKRDNFQNVTVPPTRHFKDFF